MVESRWFLYMVTCNDGTIYTGITTDIDRRVHEHNNSKKGAKYTRSRRPVVLSYIRLCENRSKASKAEAAIKKLSRKEKIEIINSYC